MRELSTLPQCRLDAAGAREQGERYATIGRHVVASARAPGRVEVELDEHAPAALVADAIAVERGCCPFFGIDYDPTARRLVVAVDEPAHGPGLSAIAAALGIG